MDTLSQIWPNLIFWIILVSPILVVVLFVMLMSKRKRIREIEASKENERDWTCPELVESV